MSPSPGDLNMRKQKDLYDNASINFRITGPNQERTCSLAKCLSSESFKEELVNFFIKHWSSEEFVQPDKKRVFVSFGDKCYVFGDDGKDGFFKGKTVNPFINNHFEIESKVILHLYVIRMPTVHVKTSNADMMLVYLLYHMQFWDNSREIWLDTGESSKNNVQTINVRQIYRSLSSEFVKALPVYEPSFFGKGRKTCLKILEKSQQFQSSFANIGNSDHVREVDVNAVEEFTCQLYGTNRTDIDDARFTLFEKAFGSKNLSNFEKGNIIDEMVHFYF